MRFENNTVRKKIVVSNLVSSLLRQSQKMSGEENVKTSPYRRHQNSNEDLEAGINGSSSRSMDCGGSPFDIPRTKSAPIDRLKRWRVSTFFFF